ncbi:MAG: autotransporter-associated beta strand repeat-containing protein [Verrucomicrobiota bacterium]
MKPKYRSLHGLHLTAIALSITGLSSYFVQAASRTWDGSSSANWATSSNWNNLPNITDTAVFSSAGGGNTTIDLGVSGVTIAAINFTTNTTAAYTIGAGAVGSQTLTLGNSGAVSVSSVVVNDQLFNANLILGTATASTYTLTNSSTTKGLTFAGTIQGGTGGTAGAKIVAIAGLGTTTVEGVISNGGGSSLSLEASSGLLILSGVNTFTGGTTIKSGVLQLANLGNSGSTTSNLGTGSTLKIGSLTSGGTLKYVGTGETSNRVIDFSGTTGRATLDASGSGLLKFTSNFTATGAGVKTLSLTGSGAGEIAGRIINNSGSNTTALTKGGDSIWTLSGANTYTGLTDVQAGTLAYGVNNAIATGAIQVSGGTLDLDTYSDTVGAVTLTGGSIAGSTGVLTGTSYAMQNGSVSAILAGAVALNKTTSGTVILSGTNTYTGVNTVSAGTLRATTSASALGTGAASLTLSGGTLELANDTGLNFARNTTLSANSTVNSDVLTPGAAGVTHSLGTLTLTGQTLTIGSGANVGSGTAGITFDAVAVNGGAVTTTFNVGAGDLLTLGAVTPAGGGSKVIAFGGNGDTTVSGVLNDASGASTASVTKSGNGTLILANANLYEAATTISRGVVRAQNNTALGTTAAGVSVSDGAALELDGAAGALTLGAEALTLNGNGVSSGGALRNVAGNNSYAGIITLASASRINADAGVLTINSSGSITGNFGLTFGGEGDIVLSNAFAPVTTTQTLTKDGAGKLTLNRANTYTGLTTVSAGTLEYGVASALSSGAVTVSGGTLDLKTFSDTVGAVTLASGNISSSSGVLTGTSYAVQSGSVGAILAGSGALTKTTAGTVILSGVNTYTGATTISAGILAINGIQSAATGNVTVASGATLKGTGTVGGATTIQSGGIHNAGAHSATSSAGTETFSTNLTYAASSIFAWDLNANLDGDTSDAGDTGTAGTNYDRVVVGGNLNIASDAVFRVIMGSSVDFATTFWDSNQVWNNIFSVTGTTTGGWAANTFVNVYNYDYANNTYSVSNPTAEGCFTVSGSTLAWNTVPEPTSALAGLLIGAGLLRRRRCRASVLNR